MLLAGDVGGTKVRIGVFDRDQPLEPVRESLYASAEHASLEAILSEFMRSHTGAAVERACFGVAGPVLDGRVALTNLGWRIEEQALEQTLGCPVRLLNDLQASAYGILELENDAFEVLQMGAAARNGAVALIAAGTGLGEAMLVWDGARYLALASEGGHVGFAPRDDLESDLLEYLRARYGGHVSYERVLSGQGLADLYAFLRARGKTREPAWLTEQLDGGNPGSIVGEVGMSGRDPVCVEALERFASIYGAKAGNLALQGFATGGVVITGGIAPKILPVLGRGGFVSSFNDKGRFRSFTERIPIRVVLHPETALIGAAHRARQAID